MKKYIVIAALLFATIAYGVTGTVTITRDPGDAPNAVISKVVFAWTSTSGGAAGDTSVAINGILLAAEFVPGSGGSQPSDLYDVTVTDAGGVDILAGQGANLSQTTATCISPGIFLKDGTTTSTIPRPLADALTLAVTNAGSVKTGQVILYVKRI